jgi:hypothetical protein
MIGALRSLRRFIAIVCAVCLSACAAHPQSPMVQPIWTVTRSGPLTGLAFDPNVKAVCDAPAGWKSQPLVSAADHADQVWLSPTGATAYGVIHFVMPFPVGVDFALSAFLDHMRKDKGEATLLARQTDPTLPGIRFVAEDQTHVIHANLFVAGWEGWAVYAGTLRNAPINQEELDIAQVARENTRVGQPEKVEN